MISRLLLIGALLAPLICHAGADRFAQERNPSVAQSFTPPITPGITGSPGANKYLYSNAMGVVGWGSLPIAASQVSYSPSTPANWPLIPSQVAAALDSLAGTLAAVSATASGRAAILSFGVGIATAISTNNYLGALGDQSATVTSVAPIVIPCTGSLVGIRAQRTTNAASTSVQQFFKSAGGGTVSYVGTGVSCSINIGSKECNAATVVPVTIGDMLIVRITGAAWSIGAGAISTKILCS